MNRDDDMRMKVEKILSRYYDFHPSLYLLSKSKKSKTPYYYRSLPYLTELKDLSTALSRLHEASKKAVADVRMSLGDESKKMFAVKLCEKKIEGRKWLCLDFYGIGGIKTARGNKGLRLLYSTEDKCSFNMRIGYGDLSLRYENKAGKLDSVRFYYSLNRLINENDEIRNIIADIFDELLSERSYIYKDIAQAIRKDHFFLISKKIDELECHYNKKSYVESEYGGHLLPKINFNRYDLNSLEVICSFFELIRKKDRHILLELGHEELLSFVDNKTFFEGISIAAFTASYYEDRFRLSNYGVIGSWAKDYALMARAEGDLIDLSIRSPERLKRLHDGYQERLKRAIRLEEIDKPLVVENSCFNGLRGILPEEFEWIRTTKRLYEESDRQSNCVYIHADRIRKDEETIYHWSHEGREYTLSFEHRHDGSYVLTEMKDRFNADPYFEDVSYVKDLLARAYIDERIGVLNDMFDSVEIV